VWTTHRFWNDDLRDSLPRWNVARAAEGRQSGHLLPSRGLRLGDAKVGELWELGSGARPNFGATSTRIALTSLLHLDQQLAGRDLRAHPESRFFHASAAPETDSWPKSYSGKPTKKRGVQHGRHNLPRVDDLFGGRAGVPQRHACVAGFLTIDHSRIEVVRHDGRDDRLRQRVAV
jgi:hypothetical protein